MTPSVIYFLSFFLIVNLLQLFCSWTEFNPFFSLFFGYLIILIFTANEYMNKQYNLIVSHESHDKHLFISSLSRSCFAFDGTIFLSTSLSKLCFFRLGLCIFAC